MGLKKDAEILVKHGFIRSFKDVKNCDRLDLTHLCWLGERYDYISKRWDMFFSMDLEKLDFLSYNLDEQKEYKALRWLISDKLKQMKNS